MSDSLTEEPGKEPLRGEIMDVNGVAEYLGLAPSTIYDKVRDMEMPHTRLGNLIRFRKSAIDQWLGQNTVRPHPSLQRALAEGALQRHVGIPAVMEARKQREPRSRDRVHPHAPRLSLQAD